MKPLRNKTVQGALHALGTLLVLGVGLLIALDLAPRVVPILTEPTPPHSEIQGVFRDLSRMLGVTLSMLVALGAVAALR